MITAQVNLDSNGSVQRFVASGHAMFEVSGNDIVCAAFSLLCRSVYASLQGVLGSRISGSAATTGTMTFEVHEIPAQYQKEISGITRVLLAGLESLHLEFPSSIKLRIETCDLSK